MSNIIHYTKINILLVALTAEGQTISNALYFGVVTSHTAGKCSTWDSQFTQAYDIFIRFLQVWYQIVYLQIKNTWFLHLIVNIELDCSKH